MGPNPALEMEVENHLRNLDKVLDDMKTDRDSLSFSRNDVVQEICEKLEASHRAFLVAKLLSEPARESMVLKVRASLSDVEELLVSQMSVKTHPSPSACSQRELAYADHIRQNGRS